ncbi:MAG: type II/IV secretion system protein, partial [Deltaproteobacteria bacterium]|nr:type II/IV secretion system protein [Deltaproteobacteria bacterium]
HTLTKMYYFLPYTLEGKNLTIVAADPTDLSMFDNIALYTGFKVEYKLGSKDRIAKILEDFFFKGAEAAKAEEQLLETVDEDAEDDEEEQTSIEDMQVDDILTDLGSEFDSSKESADDRVSDLRATAESKPIIILVNKIIATALQEKVSDIHIEGRNECVQVRYRLDGTLFDRMKAPKAALNAIVSRIKIMSDLNIAERRIPQDGAFSVNWKTGKIDFRVSILPSVLGENIVIRVLRKDTIKLDIRGLGFDDEDLNKFLNVIQAPFGIILTSGPTGSGKTTTLYSALSEINTPEVKIITVENPVEYQLGGIHQTQVFINKNDPDRSLTFAAALRSILRQDPDVVMIGELRDEETSEIAVSAALTGHLVFSTVHANTAIDTVGRMKNMGVEPDLLAAAMSLVIAQRLIRRVCSECKEEMPRDMVNEILISAGYETDPYKDITFYQGRGCDNCRGSGFSGRCGIHEVLLCTEEIKGMIIDGISAIKLKDQAVKEGMHTLAQSSFRRCVQGLSSLTEFKKISLGGH